MPDTPPPAPLQGAPAPGDARPLFRTRADVLYAVVLALLLALGVGIRWEGLDRAPAHNATADEYAWTWAGMTLWTEGMPRSWSLLPAYKHRRFMEWRGARYNIVQPWLDHPPVFALLQGAWMVARGHRDILQVDLHVMRQSGVLLFILSFVLLWRVARAHVPRTAAVLALLLYATSVPAVLNGRLVVSENLLAPMWLGAHLVVLRVARGAPRAWTALLFALAMLMPLTKLPAVCLCFPLAAVAWQLRSVLAAAAVSAGTLAGLVAFVLYGRAWDAELFRSVMDSHQGKFTGFGGMYNLLFAPRVVDVPFVYMPAILAVALAAHALFTGRRHALWSVAIHAVAYPLAMTFLVVEKQVYGWYLLPLYPLFALLLGHAFQRLSTGRAPLAWWAAVLLLGPQLAQRTVELGDMPVSTARWLFMGMVLLSPLVVRSPRQQGWRGAGLAAAGLLLWQTTVDVTYVLTR